MSLNFKTYSDLSDLEKLSLVDFSYSRIDTYNMCPAKYFYSYISKEPRQFSPPAVLGNVIHEVLENLIEKDKSLDYYQLRKEYKETIPKWDPDNLIAADLLNAGSVMIDDFYDQNQEVNFEVYAKELPFELIIGTYVIRGFIDRVDIVGNRVNIVDYKTGKWEISAKEVPNSLQLGIYALAINEIFPDKEIYAEMYYLRSGRRKGHLFTNDDLDSIKVRVVDSMKKIVNDQNFNPTGNTRVCSFCDHAKSGACATGVYRNSKSSR